MQQLLNSSCQYGKRVKRNLPDKPDLLVFTQKSNAMKSYDKRNISQVLVPGGKKLITCRNIEEESIDSCSEVREHLQRIKNDMRHFGRCHRVTITDYAGYDYTQDEVPCAEVQPQKQVPHVFIDLKHGSMIKLVDLSHFDRKPDSIIRIVPKDPVRFHNVTVRVCDLFNRELVHDHAWDEDDIQEWIFSYFPRRRFSPEPVNLQITISASEKPRDRTMELVDVYELPVEKLREMAACTN